ncbi:MAG: hypothetical protein ACREJ2_00580, partial [Planctomycetota bacterium]
AGTGNAAGPATAPAPADPLEGQAIEITGPDSIRPDEHVRGVVRFARVTKPHTVVIRWVDTKGRVCAEKSADFTFPEVQVPYDFAVPEALGTDHRIEASVDGQAQAVSHPFYIERAYTPWVDYKACVWGHYEPGFMPTLRSIGISGSIWQGQMTVDSDFAFYPDNICYEIFSYYHKRRDEDDAMKAAQFKHPNDPYLFHRRPSLTDPGTWDKVRDRLLSVVNEVKGYRPLFYNVADEIGIGDQSEPTDYDWEYSSRDAWTAYLISHYGTLDKLNAEWGTHYESWGAVRAFFPQTDAMYYQLWRDTLLPASFTDIAGFNKQFGTKYASFDAVVEGYRAICTDDEGVTEAGLKQTYGKIEKLNRTLGTSFADFAAAAKYIADFERWVHQQNGGDERNWNLAWWCDFRDYMDDYMADGIKKACDIGRAADPGGRFGITGTHHPGVFNGHNYVKLLKGIDCIIPYDIGQSYELIRGLKPDMYFMHPTWATGEHLQRDLWYYFFMGCRGVLFWDNDEPNNRLINRGTGAPTERGDSAKPVLKEIASGTDRLLLESTRENSGIAIYQSQASERVTWWQCYVNLGRDWMKRHSWDEYKHDENSVLRTSWIKLIEDNHLQFIFVSPEQVADGRLAAEHIRVLILPEVWALSDAEAANIEAFARAGGTVIADQDLGRFDEHGKWRANGVLDQFFGIDQDAIHGDRRKQADPKAGPTLVAGEKAAAPPALDMELGPGLTPATAMEDLNTGAAPVMGLPLEMNSGAEALAGSQMDAALVVRSHRFDTQQKGVVGPIHAEMTHGVPAIKGETIFMNLDVSNYSRVRLTDPAKTEKLVALLRALLPPEVQPPAQILDATTGGREPGTEVGCWDAGGGRRFVAVWHNYENLQDGTDAQKKAARELFESPEQIRIVLDRPEFVLDQRTGKSFGRTQSVVVALDPWQPVILACQDSSFQEAAVVGPAEAARGTTVHFAVDGTQNPAGALQVFRLDAVNPAGQAVWYYTFKTSTRDGHASFEVPLALNEMPGNWKFTITDAATQKQVERTVAVK